LSEAGLDLRPEPKRLLSIATVKGYKNNALFVERAGFKLAVNTSSLVPYIPIKF
jgi:hypothetical protein